MAAPDHGTKVSFPAGAPEFEIPEVNQHLPVQIPQGVQDASIRRASPSNYVGAGRPSGRGFGPAPEPVVRSAWEPGSRLALLFTTNGLLSFPIPYPGSVQVAAARSWPETD